MAYASTWSDKREDILRIAEEVKLRHPDAWEEVKVPGQKSRRYINLVSIAGLAAGLPIGVNLKRGGPEQSIDAIALPNATGARDSTGKYPGLEIVDIVVFAERYDAHLGWGDVTQATIDAGVPGGWQAGTLNSNGHGQGRLIGVPRDELRDFFTVLDDEYRRRGRGNRTSDPRDPIHVDNEGIYVWLPEYIRYRQTGKSKSEATAAVLADIDAAWPK